MKPKLPSARGAFWICCCGLVGTFINPFVNGYHPAQIAMFCWWLFWAGFFASKMRSK